MASRVRVETGRIALQAGTVAGLRGALTEVEFPVWLLLLDPGYLRVLPHDYFGALEDHLQADAMDLETRQERERIAALHLRLTKSKIVPDRRLMIPQSVFELSGEYLDREHVWVEQSATRLDVYTASYVQRILALPIPEFLPKSVDMKPVL